MGVFWKYKVLAIVTSLATCVIGKSCSAVNETYCDATDSCQGVNETCFDCCGHVNKRCETVELFGKICEHLPLVCSELGQELWQYNFSSAAHMSSHYSHPLLTYSITVTVGPSGVTISSALAHSHDASASHFGSMNASMATAMSGSREAASSVVASMSGSEVVFAISSQIATLSASQGESLSASQIASVISSEIASLSAAQGVSLSSFQEAQLSASQAVTIISSQIASQSASQVASLTASQVASIISSDIAGTSASLFSVIGSSVSGHASASHAIGSSTAVSMRASHMASMSASHAASMRASHIASRSISHAGSMRASHTASRSVSHGASRSVSHAASMRASHTASRSVSHAASMSASHAVGMSASYMSGGVMSWSSLETSVFGTMVASINPSSYSHFPSSSPAIVGPPWWSSESMKSWLSFIKNNSMCGHGEKFCGLNLQCIPGDQPCTVYLSNDAMKNLSNTAWCVNCSSEEYFCPLFMQCINVSENCSYENFDKWINSNASMGLADLACGKNETFSFATMECVPGKHHGHGECGHGELFCPYSASCKNKTDCAPLPERNYTEVLKNDSFGWARMCQFRNLVCPRVAMALEDCKNDRRKCNSSCPDGQKACNDHHCIPVDQKCCIVGEKFCNLTNLCLPNGTMCCPTGQQYCRYTGGCEQLADCLPPVANVTFPTVWEYLQLGDMLSKGIFEQGDVAVALRSLETHGVNGSLEFYNNSKWTAVNALTPTTALVLGKTSYLRFNSTRKGSHGIVLINFTVYDDSSKVGQHMDAASKQWTHGKTIAIFVLPSVVPPEMVYNGSLYTVAEDSRGEFDFDIWNHLYDSSLEVDTESHIPDAILADVNRKMVELYNELLGDLSSLKHGLKIKTTSENIKFEGGKAKDYHSNMTKIKFTPKEDFHGDVKISMETFLASPKKSSLAISRFFSHKVTEALHMTAGLKGGLQDLGKKVLFKIMKDNLKPTSDNIRTAVQNLNGITLNASAAQAVFDHVDQIINSSKEPDGDSFSHISADRKIIEVDQSGEVLFHGNVTMITITVTPVNDRPVVKYTGGTLDPLPYNLFTGWNPGTFVRDIFDQSKTNPLAEDIDDRAMELGAVILSVGNGSLGRWQYQMNSSMAFQEFTFDQDAGEVFLLPPAARIKMELYDNQSVWSFSQALKRGAVIQVRAWDMTDGNVPGLFNTSILSETSVSKKFANLRLLRRGCDNKTDFPSKNDRCGVCRGNNACVKCDGVPHSDAFYNDCGFCVLGNTNKTADYKIDCAGHCDKNVRNNDTCGECMNKNNIRNLKDCTGSCFGKADYDDCGNCTGGNTGLKINFRQDSCNVCGGDNTSCTDCLNVINGDAEHDFCGNCKSKSDPSINNGCAKFGRLDPVSGRAGARVQITVKGAGFKSQTLTSCEFNHTTTSEKYPASSSNHISNKNTLTVTAPSNLPSGIYSVLCSFVGNVKIESEAAAVFTVYNSSVISLSSVSPNETEISDSGMKVNISITGTNFVDTGYVACVREGGAKLATGVFVSSTEVYCLITTFRISALFNVTLQFGKNDPTVASSVEFSFFAIQPSAVSLTFDSNPIKLLLSLDKKAKHKSDNPQCSDFFDQGTIALFAADTKCKLVRPKTLQILLVGGGATITPGNSVNFTNGSLAALGEDNTKFVVGTTELFVQSPQNPVVPEVEIQGAKFIGPCASLDIETDTKGDGGRPLTYEWYVKNIVGADANTTSDLSSLNSTLTGLAPATSFFTITKDFIVKNVEYEIVCKATNFLGESVEDTLSVTRKNDAVPEVKLSTLGETMSKSERRLIRASVSLPGCNGSDASGFEYAWELKDSSGELVDLGSGTDSDKPYLKLQGSNLDGGKNYTLIVTVSDKANLDISAEVAIPIEVTSSSLIPRISGGFSFDVGYEDFLVLDGSESEDPDETDDDPNYQWECTDSEGNCFFNNRRVLLNSTAVVNKSVASFLESGKTYTFTLTYRKGIRSEEETVSVRVQQCSPPNVKILPQKSNKLNAKRKIAVRGSVRAVGFKVSLEYSFVLVDGYGYESDITDLVLASPPSEVTSATTRLNQGFGVYFKKNALVSGKYRFRVSANTTACSSYSETEFTVNGPPTEGKFEVTPVIGTVLDTEFTFRANQFNDDSEDYPLKYQFGYYELIGGEEIASVISLPNQRKSRKVSLPQGDENNNNTLRVFVRVFDKFGASVTTEKTIQVSPKVFSLADLQNLQSSATNLEESGDLENQLGTMNTVLSAISDTSANASDEVTASLNAIKQQYTQMAVKALEAVTGDKDAEFNALSTMGKTTEGGADAFDESTKNNFFALFKKLLGVVSSPSKRRRRAVENEILDVDSLTGDEAETTLRPAANLIAPDIFTLEESNRKSDFLSLVYSIGLKMCAGQGTGAPAVFAKTTRVTLRAETVNFAGINDVSINMACSDCPTFVKQTAKMTLGKTLEATYKSWSCSSSETCSGACILSTQYPEDLLYNQTDFSRLTDIVDVKLYNPTTFREVTVGSLAEPVAFLIPLQSGKTFPNESTNSAECKLWSSNELNWTTTGCVSGTSPVISGNVTHVECNCTTLGYLSAFVGPKREEVTTAAPTTAAPTTAAPTTAAPTTAACELEPKSSGVNVKFVFNVSYPSVVGNNSQKAAVQASIINAITSSSNLEECSIQDFSLTAGSLVVKFVAVPKKGQTIASLQQEVIKIETKVKAATFQITLPNGQVISADQNSFETSLVTPTTVAATAASATPTESGSNNTTVIIVACVCGGVALIVIIAVAVHCWRKKRGSGKISPSTSPEPGRNSREDLEMNEQGQVIRDKDQPGENNNREGDF